MHPIVSNGNELKWKFENMNELTEKGIFSDKFTFKNIDWEIKVRSKTVNSSKYLDIDLCYDGDNESEKNYICTVEIIFKLLNQKGNGKDHTTEANAVFYNSGCDEDESDLTYMEWSKLESDGYMKDDSIIVEIKFDFKLYDFSKKIPNYTDITFDVQGTKFYANKGVLCSRSEYFYNKFIVDNSDEKELTIENVKVCDFLYFIASFCLFFERVEDDNYEQLMKLADEYKTPQLHRNCEKFLILEEDLEVEKKIEYADKYNYDELMKSCIDSITRTEQIKKLRDSIEFKNLKNTNKLAIMTHLLNLL